MVRTDIDFIDCLRNKGAKELCMRDYSKDTATIKESENVYQVNFTNQRIALIKTKLRENELSEEKITSLKKSIQVCDNAWTTLKDKRGNKQMQYVLLIDI